MLVSVPHVAEGRVKTRELGYTVEMVLRLGKACSGLRECGERTFSSTREGRKPFVALCPPLPPSPGLSDRTAQSVFNASSAPNAALWFRCLDTAGSARASECRFSLAAAGKAATGHPSVLPATVEAEAASHRGQKHLEPTVKVKMGTITALLLLLLPASAESLRARE